MLSRGSLSDLPLRRPGHSCAGRTLPVVAVNSLSRARAATAFQLAWTPSSAQEHRHRPSCFSQLDARSTPLVRVRSFSQRRDMYKYKSLTRLKVESRMPMHGTRPLKCAGVLGFPSVSCLLPSSTRPQTILKNGSGCLQMGKSVEAAAVVVAAAAAAAAAIAVAERQSG
jgi:hypothetical protein